MTNLTDSEVKQVKNYQNHLLNKVEKLTQSKWGLLILSLISLVESALPVPLLTDPFLAASVLFNRSKVFVLVLVTTLSSVIGGILAYYLAFFAFDLLANMMSANVMVEFNNLADENTSGTLALTLVGAVTPVPYTIVAWLIAVLKGNILIFIVGSIIGRGFRYSVVGYCTYKFGPMALDYAKKYIVTSSVIVFLIAGLVIWLKM